MIRLSLSFILSLLCLLYQVESYFISPYHIHHFKCGSERCYRTNNIVGNSHLFQQVPITEADAAKSNIKQLSRAAGIIYSGILVHASATEAAVETNGEVTPKPANRPVAYSVEFTDPPCLQPRSARGEIGAIKRFSEADVIILGEHQYSQDDHELQANLISRTAEAAQRGGRKPVIGLEMVQRGNTAFQAALDTYIKSSKNGIDEKEADEILVRDTDWLNRWQWDFEVYKSVFHLARKQGIPLVALGLANETKQRVLADGLDGLIDEDRTTFVPDPIGFIESVRGEGFQRYTDKVVLPLYEFYFENKLLGSNPSPEKFFSSKIIADEAIATAAADYVYSHPNTVMMVMTGIERVKFGYGVRERIVRRLRSLRAAELKSDGVTPGPTPTDKAPTPVPTKVLSVLLNPTARDSLSQTVQLQLVLAYGPFLKDQRPLADFLWYSRSPPVRLLTRPKNPINSEGEKPPGESSILGAF